MDTANLIVSSLACILAVFATFYIPQKIMKNQILSDLVAEYRTPEMGVAVVGIVRFFKEDCSENIENVDSEYRKRYEIEIVAKNYTEDALRTSLHFKRRLLGQYYQQLATLRFGKSLVKVSEKNISEYFTWRESKLIEVIYHMNATATSLFLKIDSPPVGHKPENRLNEDIRKLQLLSKSWI